MPGAAYDDFANYYDEFITGPIYSDVVLPALWEMMPPVEGLRICDVACGQGIVSRGLAERGAHVNGVDLSAALLQLARGYEQNQPLGIQYLQGDAETLQSLADESFDGAVCTMALMDIQDFEAAIRSVRRILRDRGWFIVAITHPCWEAPHARWDEHSAGRPARIVHQYRTEGFWRAGNPEGLRYRVGARHRTLSSYINALANAGFCIERMAEPSGSGPRFDEVPGNREMPSVLMVRATAMPRVR